MGENRIFKRRRNIERATAFRVQFAIVGGDVDERDFTSLKSARQWIERNGDTFDVVVIKMMALIDSEWEPITTIGKKTITLSDLENIVRDLREEYKPSNIEK